MPSKSPSTPEQDALFSLENEPELPTGETLDDVYAAIADHRCGLCQDKSRFVFGEGKAGAKLMFIGESPSHDDAIVGRPFLGPTGEILDKIIAAIGFKREDCYLSNVVKCPYPARSPI